MDLSLWSAVIFKIKNKKMLIWPRHFLYFMEIRGLVHYRVHMNQSIYDILQHDNILRDLIPTSKPQTIFRPLADSPALLIIRSLNDVRPSV